MSKERQEVKKESPSGTDRKAAQEDIQTLAYQLFCECGCAHGHDVEHWLEAERRVLAKDWR